MGNRAVITQHLSAGSPAIYLHWNGGRASVEGFLEGARHACLHGDGEAAMDRLAGAIAQWMGTSVNAHTVYRNTYGECDADNGDNGVYLIDENFRIVSRRFVPDHIESFGEEHDPEKTAQIASQIEEEACHLTFTVRITETNVYEMEVAAGSQSAAVKMAVERFEGDNSSADCIDNTVKAAVINLE